ncbi:hypothetical protein ABZ547_08400 [Streptomyces sparsogenes]|uniref:hypothetical protein n=1 Tax=Streptomyces sparsogenes TaxID=67365 RepID=UPI0033F88593
MTAPSPEQMRVLADRAERGPLSAAEARWLRAGIDRIAVACPQQESPSELAVLRRRLAALHRPMLRGGIEVCAECSGWDGRRCRGLVTEWPCPTAEAAGLDEQRRAA